jgi:hypothetical protein
MKTLALILAGVLAVASVPAEARGFHGPRIGIGLGFGAPYGWYDPWYDPWFYPYPYWYGPYPPRAPVQDQAKENLFVYPDKGQTEAQTTQDRKECNDWAVQQSGLDPATAKRREKNQHLGDYNRAFAACMEGRDYTVK